ncbi:MAG: neutral/alkaline non-lysosomal ceramidase N-terminal domain-containing protein [Thermoproteota archaeon]|uniref:neutral/alkaline non-lysosomal ceramidase N-terminal domain-containing protein n=1 Tax=Thermoprotei TaxID=183924 RepID=UPI00315F324F
MENLIAGVAKRDVTPEPGVYLGGYFDRTKASIGVHDSLFARALYLSDGKENVLFIGTDQLCMCNQVIPGYLSVVREQIESTVGVKSENIIIYATHTHSAPDPFNLSEKNYKYFETLQKELVKVGVEACNKRYEAILSYAKSKIKVGINRRNPEGPIDPDLTIVKVSSLNEKPLALLINYACHAVVLGSNNLLISSDWVGDLESTLEEKYNPAIAMFLPGASGNINPRTRDLEEKLKLGHDIYDRTSGSFEEVKRFALTVVEEVEQALQNEIICRKVKIENKTTKLKVKIENEMISKMIGKDEITTMVSVTKIGDLLIVALPGEAFVEEGLNLKLMSKYVTIPLTLANDYVGYLPTEKAFTEGGYEPGVSIGMNGVSKILNTAKELVQEFSSYSSSASKL